MQRADLPEVAEFAALHAKKRRILVALLGNVLLLLVMVGGPWLRGYLRTRALWHSFARFGACLYGGTPNPEPGLGLPRGSEAQFAARVIERAADWPERCAPALDALSPDEPIFLLPSVKRAEADLRAAAALVRRELSALAVRVPGERLSTRPLRAVEHLRAALSRHALAAGALEVPEADAFQRARGHGLPIPTRVPLYASSDARVALWGADDDLHALAVDRTGVSYVRVAGGGLEQMRLPRPKLLEAFLPDAQGGGLFVWAMPRARCRERAAGCANKSMGLAALRLPLSVLPEPRWFGAHPAGRVERSVWARAGRVLVAAEAAERRVEVRELALPEAAPAPATDLPPLPPVRSWRASAPGEPWVVEIAGEPWVLVAQASERATELLRLTPDAAQPQLLAQLPAGKQAWLTGSSCAGGAAFGFGSDSATLLGSIEPDGKLSLHPALPLGLSQVVDDADAAHDRVRNLCAASGAAFALARDPRDNLLVITCAQAGECQTRAIASGVQSFAALGLEEQVLVAYAGSRNLAQLRLQTLGPGGETRAAERIAGACWAPTGGMCGTPLLGQVGARVLLGAREGTDLMLLESADRGASWEPLRGLKRNESQAL